MTTALETTVGEADIKHQMLRDSAMQRLYELDPEAAKPYILEEIRHPHVDNNMGTVKAQTLFAAREADCTLFENWQPPEVRLEEVTGIGTEKR
jgi:hypothetical protein